MPDTETQNAIWQALAKNQQTHQHRSIVSLFDDARLASFTAESDDLHLDFSKTNIDSDALELLIKLAESCHIAEKRDAMFAGDKINITENRAVLHTALRAAKDSVLTLDDEDIIAPYQKTFTAMQEFATNIHNGTIISANQQKFTDCINIGIGGSDLGPLMATKALTPYHTGLKCHFLSNIDGAAITDLLAGLNPHTTLIIIASKTFTTTETMVNAKTAIAWLKAHITQGAEQHLVAISSAPDKTAEFNIAPNRVFGFGDWVGGRYSLWGPIGLPIMLAVGVQNFQDFLSGGASMDKHFCHADMRQNLPILLALTGIFHRNICGYATRAILPYDQRLARLPAYLQQLDMESNGKSVDIDGKQVTRASGPIIWGEAGTNGQHAFYQLLHQGTDIIPTEFLIAANGHEPDLKHHHDLLKANCLAQSEALMIGRNMEQAMEIAAQLGYEGEAQKMQAAHRFFAGNRPSITLAYPTLTPFVLGQIIALYEHRVFVEGVIWHINSFDQWGVELGKELANTLLPMLHNADPIGKDKSTINLLQKLKG